MLVFVLNISRRIETTYEENSNVAACEYITDNAKASQRMLGDIVAHAIYCPYFIL
jgi:hypothetical protein